MDFNENCVKHDFLGAEKVIVVIGDTDNLEEKWTTKWKENQFSKTLQQFHISRAELDWIVRREVHRKIEEIRKSLIIHTGMDNLV